MSERVQAFQRTKQEISNAKKVLTENKVFDKRATKGGSNALNFLLQVL